MRIPTESWYDAIAVRHSRRNFNGQKIPDDILSNLKAVSESFHAFPGSRVVMMEDTPENLFRGIIGSYGAVSDAPHCIVMIGNMSGSHVQEAVGYHGEGLVLEATVNGIDSCWIGGFFREEALGSHVDLAPDEQILGTIALGHARESKSKVEKMMSGLIGSERRKALKDLLYIPSEEPKRWMSVALEAARRAPSAVNRQPWRFKIIDNEIGIYCTNNGISKNISPRLDCGIAMLHLELGALKAGVSGNWEFQDSEPFTRFVVT